MLVGPVHLSTLIIQYTDCPPQTSCMGCRHSSVDSSVPTILPPQVSVPSKPSMHLSFIVFVLHLSCEKDENKQKVAGFGPFLKKHGATYPHINTIGRLWAKIVRQILPFPLVGSLPQFFSKCGQTVKLKPINSVFTQMSMRIFHYMCLVCCKISTQDATQTACLFKQSLQLTFQSFLKSNMFIKSIGQLRLLTLYDRNLRLLQSYPTGNLPLV